MISGFLARIRSLVHGIGRRPALESRMSEEFRGHIELRAADLVRAGRSPADAMRQARIEFGSTERYKDEARDARGLRRIDLFRVSWLDFKLGLRMLVRYPGLTLIGGLAMAFAIWIGTTTFELMTQVLRPTLPLADGERIVGILTWDAQSGQPHPAGVSDFVRWREQLRSIEDLGASRVVQRNVVASDAIAEPIAVAEVSASAFRVTRVAPLLGRVLVDADEAASAPRVAVIGHDLWRRRFGADPNVVGRTIRIGRLPSTVVGVMPEGYAFPINHTLWTPLRAEMVEPSPRGWRNVMVFGRLAPGVSREEAQAEVAALGERMAADAPDTYEHLRPEVVHYPKAVVRIDGEEKAIVSALNVPMLMLFILICGNVALLMFARAATREMEIAVRTALGASRSRIVMQLFAEALVLGTVSATVGLALAGPGLQWVMRVAEVDMLDGHKLPFWFHGSLSPTTVLYAVLLTVLAAVIAGVVPGLKVTRGMGPRLQQASAGGGGMRFGGVWTAVIVSQVAVTVAFPASAWFARSEGVRIAASDPGFAAERYLAARFELDSEPPPGVPVDTSRATFVERYDATYAEIERRLIADGSVAGVTYGDRLPGMSHPARLIEVNEGGVAPIHPDWPAGYRVSWTSVDPSFFAVLGTPILTGRGFQAGDLAANAVPVIVNQSFVRLVLGERNPIGRRLRYLQLREGGKILPPAERGMWYEIVGVVRDLGTAETGDDPKVARIYHPTTPVGAYPARIAVHVTSAPEAFAPRLRSLAAEIDPNIRLYDVASLSEVNAATLQGLDFWVQLLAIISGIALLLSLAGIYSVMSFIVARRTREIGIRVALGASQRRVIAAIFVRPLMQVTIGIAVGSVLITSLFAGSTTRPVSLIQIAGMAGYAVFMLLVCMLACIVPTRRALRVQPTEALRGEG